MLKNSRFFQTRDEFSSQRRTSLAPSQELTHARRRLSPGRRVQLNLARGARPPGSSPAPDPGDGRRGPGRALAGHSPRVEAYASLKSPRRKDGDEAPPPDDPGNPTVNFRGERRSNATHGVPQEPEARLARHGPGREAKLAYQGHVLMENRHGLAVAVEGGGAPGTPDGGGG